MISIWQALRQNGANRTPAGRFEMVKILMGGEPIYNQNDELIGTTPELITPEEARMLLDLKPQEENIMDQQYANDRARGRDPAWMANGPSPGSLSATPRPPDVSVSQGADMVWGQSNLLVSKISAILGRMELAPTGAGEANNKEMPITLKLTSTYENLSRVESLMDQLAIKIFG